MKTNQFASILIASHARIGNRSDTAKPVRAKPHKAFTVIELLVILVLVALMVTLLATAHAGNRPNSQGALCLNNMRQLMAGFTMYTMTVRTFSLLIRTRFLSITRMIIIGSEEMLPVGCQRSVQAAILAQVIQIF